MPNRRPFSNEMFQHSSPELPPMLDITKSSEEAGRG